MILRFLFHLYLQLKLLRKKELQKTAQYISLMLTKSSSNAAEWSGEFINNKDLKEKYFSFVKQSRGVKDEYKITEKMLKNSPEAEELGKKENREFLVNLLFNGDSKIIFDDSFFEIKTIHNFLEKIKEAGKKGVTIQRYKGLGEMNPEQLWQTTLDPEKRTLLQVQIEDEMTLDETFVKLMGEKVEPRRDYIQTNAKKVVNLDI